MEAREIELIVKQVIQKMEVATDKSFQPIVHTNTGDYGVFENVEEAIEAAFEAGRIYMDTCNLDDRNRIIEAIRVMCRLHAAELGEMSVRETRLGRVEDKIQKILVTTNGTPGTECLTTDAITGDAGLMLEEYAPFGVIGAITPVTNPTETIINNTISMIAGGNSVVFNVHPSAKNVCAYCLQLLNRVIVENGGPINLITMVKEPTMGTIKVITGSPKIRLLVGTGGMGLVNSLLRSGKKTIGAGAGNPPVVVDETADIALAGKEIFRGASFDNNVLCLAEKEVFVVNSVADQLVNELQNAGAYLLNEKECGRILELVFTHDDKGYHPNKLWVGQDAGKMLQEIGINRPDVRLLICETKSDHPFVLVEQLMPVLPIVRCATFEEAMEGALRAENGNRHTSSMFSTNVNNMTVFARKIETTIFVKNGATLKGVGVGGNGHVTMTIAGPTGEGLTCAKSFTRRRRCMLAEGGFRIV